MNVLVAAAVVIAAILFFLHFAPLIIGIALTVFWVVMLVDVVMRQFRDNTTRIVWVLVVLFGHAIGAVIYYLFGREGTLAGSSFRRF